MNKKYSKQIRNIRFDTQVLEICDRYIESNSDINFSILVRVALSSFLISKDFY